MSYFCFEVQVIDQMIARKRKRSELRRMSTKNKFYKNDSDVICNVAVRGIDKGEWGGEGRGKTEG